MSKNFKISFVLLILTAFVVMGSIGQSYAEQTNSDGLTAEVPTISGGAEAYIQAKTRGIPAYSPGPPLFPSLIPKTISIGAAFEGFNFDDNITENGGFLFIPPDPIGAAGPESVIAVVNVMIEARDKTGTLLWRDGLKDFFSSLGNTLGTYTFDPKVIYCRGHHKWD
jgi:hypothetical protein